MIYAIDMDVNEEDLFLKKFALGGHTLIIAGAAGQPLLKCLKLQLKNPLSHTA